MQEAGGHFLAGPRRTGDQHPAAGVGDALQRRAHLVDGARIAGEFVRRGEAFAQPFVLAAQALRFGRPGDQVQELLRLERLFDEVHRAATDRRNGGVDIAVAGEYQHRQVGLARLDCIEHLQSVARRSVQPDIQQDEARPARVHHGKRRFAIAGGAAFVALVAQNARNQVANVAFVVDDQNIECHSVCSQKCHSPPSPGSRRSAGWTAKRSRARVPPSSEEPKARSPPCSSTIFFTMARPRPVPFSRVVT